MRLFVGIALPEDVTARVRAVVDELRPIASLRWSRAADLHVTTKFIGEQPSARVVDIERALGAVSPRVAFSLAVRGLGWFPDERAPRVLWAGLDAPANLAALAADTEDALIPLGVSKEQRPYVPHITLARVSSGARLEALRDALGAMPSPEFGAFTVDGFTLYESGGHAGESRRYRPLNTFSFTSPR